MTHEEFREICLKEYPKIEQMVKTVKALGLYKVSCSVWADGHIHFDASESGEAQFASYHASNATAGAVESFERSKDGRVIWHESATYETALADDETEDDLPFS